MDTRLDNAMKAHRRKLAALEAGPRPFGWEDAGSIAYHRDAIRVIEKYLRAGLAIDMKRVGVAR